MTRRPAASRLTDDGTLLGSRAAAAAFAHRHVNAVRRHCRPVACDVATRADLYDLDAAVTVLAGLQRRAA